MTLGRQGKMHRTNLLGECSINYFNRTLPIPLKMPSSPQNLNNRTGEVSDFSLAISKRPFGKSEQQQG